MFRISLILLTASVAACGSMKDKAAFNQAAPTITTVRIDLLKCACDESVQVAARNAMEAEFFKRADVQIVKDGPADVVLDGTLTHTEASVSQGKYSVFSAGSGSTAGKYPSGITLMARRGDSLIATGGYSMPVKAGKIPSLEGMAASSASSVMRALFANGMKPKPAQ